MITRRNFVHSAGAFIAAASFTGSVSTAFGAVQKNIKYGPNRLDVYSPTGKSGMPIMMFVHGGAWALGSRGQVGKKAEYFTNNGFVFVSVGYSLYPGADVEKQFRQIVQAVDFVRANADRFGGDPDRIILMGHSAGCHLSSLATLSGEAKGVRGLICNDTGAYDLFYLSKINGGALPVIYAAPFRRRNRWVRWSPITYADRNPYLPVMVPWSGGRNRDRITANFLRKLESHDSDITEFDGSRYSHASINTSIGKPRDKITRAIMDFTEKAFSKPICQSPDKLVGNECVKNS